jgi:uncharacterized protein YeaO (DUF488 family)
MTAPEVVNQKLLELAQDLVAGSTDLREQWKVIREDWEGFKKMAMDEIERLNQVVAERDKTIAGLLAEIETYKNKEGT